MGEQEEKGDGKLAPDKKKKKKKRPEVEVENCAVKFDNDMLVTKGDCVRRKNAF